MIKVTFKLCRVDLIKITLEYVCAAVSVRSAQLLNTLSGFLSLPLNTILPVQFLTNSKPGWFWLLVTDQIFPLNLNL